MRSTLATVVGLALLSFFFVSPCRYATQKTLSGNVLMNIIYLVWASELRAHMQKTLIAKRQRKTRHILQPQKYLNFCKLNVDIDVFRASGHLRINFILKYFIVYCDVFRY